jgi:hypothetical protein
MRREPSLTFRGALEILGHREPKLVDGLNKILGIVILAGGTAAGMHAVGAAALPAAGLWAAIWGWTEQKNAALDLLRGAINSVSGKLAGTGWYERRQLIAAAHTTIVVAAVFEAFREGVGKEFYDKLKITDTEKATLLTGQLRTKGETLFDWLYTMEVPAPSASLGFEENIDNVNTWTADFLDVIIGFIEGLAKGSRVQLDSLSIRTHAVERYRGHFLELAAQVPEFAIWAMLGENAATRKLVREKSTELSGAMGQNRDALARVEALLALTVVWKGGDVRDLRGLVDTANREALTRPILAADEDRYGGDITSLAIGQMYINPRFRSAIADSSARPADGHWWDAQPTHGNFDEMLAGYVITPDATRLPLLLLGDPGAGKSMLTQVFAARLPSTGYTAVRVPLRRVGSNAPIVTQIEEALYRATNRRVDWGNFCDQTADTIRVVMLDGLDELLQASRNDRSGYLQEIMEFQRIEAEQERPVIVVVTSRVVVADRVNIPPGTTVVKLDVFTDHDIADWLSRWSEANAAAITAGTIRVLTPDAALRQGDLARQPLLLLMLALYTADPALPALDADIAITDLYQRLLEEFARREARKDLGDHTQGRDLERQVRDHLDRLAIAALGMFNRGRQEITEEDLGADLKAIDERLMGRSNLDEAGQRVIGEFFFVHAPEAHPLTSEDGQAGYSSSAKSVRRSYEFLHATFGEYLVASRVMDELIEVAAKTFAGRYGPSDPDDDLLFALLSHQPLAARRSTLTFAAEFRSRLSDAEWRQILSVLEMLLGSYRDRHDSARYSGYRPTHPDAIRQLACYSANLVSLRVTLESDGASVPLPKLLQVADLADGIEQWRSMVALWQAGLDADGMQSMLASLSLEMNPPGVRADDTSGLRPMTATSDGRDILLARLLGDRDAELRTRYGAAIWDQNVYAFDDPRDWMHVMHSWLIALITGKSNTEPLVLSPPPEVPDEDVEEVARLIFLYLRNSGFVDRLGIDVLRLLFRLPTVFHVDQFALARVVLLDPSLLAEVPELWNPEIYGEFYRLILAVGSGDLLNTLGGGVEGRTAHYGQEVSAMVRLALSS